MARELSPVRTRACQIRVRSRRRTVTNADDGARLVALGSSAATTSDPPRSHRNRPVTPEVAGSSPVAPVLSMHLGMRDRGSAVYSAALVGRQIVARFVGSRVEPRPNRVFGVSHRLPVGAVDLAHRGAHEAGQFEDRDPCGHSASLAKVWRGWYGPRRSIAAASTRAHRNAPGLVRRDARRPAAP